MFSQDKKEGLEIIKNLYAFGEGGMLDCNIYCIFDQDSKEIALFDLGNGMSLKGLFEGMKNFGLDYNNITKVFLTHEHVDHVLGIYPLMLYLKKNPPEILAYGETANILKNGDQAQIFPENLGISPSMFGVEIIPRKVTDISTMKEINFFSEFKFQLITTPGHSLGSVSYYEPSKKILIPGDVVFCNGSFGRFDFPGGSLKELKNSIKILNDLDVKHLLPGHMGITDKGNQHIESSYRMIQSSYF
jgi:glyoxylase-like metal-dependent hydrolase (beta-lactamase superfamily II)